MSPRSQRGPLTYEATITSSHVCNYLRRSCPPPSSLSPLLLLFVSFPFFLYSLSGFNKRDRGAFNLALLLMVYWLWGLYILAGSTARLGTKILFEFPERILIELSVVGPAPQRRQLVLTIYCQRQVTPLRWVRR